MKKSILIIAFFILNLIAIAGSGDKIKYYSNGNIKEKITQNPQYFEVIKYYESGAIEEIEHFNLEKEKDGQWFRYYENGIMMGTATFKNNKKNGIWKMYDVNGKLSMFIKYKNNRQEMVCMLTDQKELAVK